MINIVCSKCDSDDIDMSAKVHWDIIHQDYICVVSKKAWCNKCKDIVDTKEIQLL